MLFPGGFQERISTVNRRILRIRQIQFGWGLSICGLLCGCGTAHPTVKLDSQVSIRRGAPPEDQGDAVQSGPAGDAEIQGVAFFDVESAGGSDPTSEPQFSGWSLATIESLALSNNPSIQQASASANKAMGFRDQVGRKPNPVLGYNATQLADAGTDQHIAFVEQDYVTAGKLEKNQRVLDQEVQSQLWEVQTQRQRVLTDVRQNFYTALAAQRRVELALEFQTVAEKGVKTAQARLDAKEGSRTDLLQAEIQLKQVQVQMQQAQANQRGAWKQLVTLAGVPETSPQPLVGRLPEMPIPRDWQMVSAEILGSSPELQSARSRLCRAQANVDRQEAQATPNLSFALAAGRDNGTGSGMINAQVGMPIPIHNANQGNISAAHAEYCRASQDVRRTELAIQSRLAQAQNDYESSASAVDQYRSEILPRAVETLKLVEEAYAAGEFDFLQVLVARRTYFDSNLAYLNAQSDLAQATSMVDGLVLTGGLETTRDTEFDSGLRDQALNGQ